MATRVVVPGACGGAWSRDRLVIPLLRREDNHVCPVALTGLGERHPACLAEEGPVWIPCLAKVPRLWQPL